MALDHNALRASIRAKVIELAERIGADAREIGDDDLIPAAGALDSSAILELVVWYEAAYDLGLRQEEINIDNLGSINAMATFAIRRKGKT